MLTNKKKYNTMHTAMNTWRDYMKSMGFGYPLGVDLPGEKRGMIPNASYYDKVFKNNLKNIVTEINTYLYEDGGMTA